jgi:hypothetical protein
MTLYIRNHKTKLNLCLTRTIKVSCSASAEAPADAVVTFFAERGVQKMRYRFHSNA